MKFFLIIAAALALASASLAQSQLWKREFGVLENQPQFIRLAQVLPDGGAVYAGSAYQALVVRMDSDGRLLWRHEEESLDQRADSYFDSFVVTDTGDVVLIKHNFGAKTFR